MAMITITLDNMSKLASPHARTVEDRIKGLIPWLFDFNVPWYLENSQGLEEWELMFVIRYWEREIAFDTITLFKMKLWQLLCQKMPYYRLLADQMGLIGNIFINIDEQSTGNETGVESLNASINKDISEELQENGYVDTDSVSKSNTSNINDVRHTENNSATTNEITGHTRESETNGMTDKTLAEKGKNTDTSDNITVSTTDETILNTSSSNTSGGSSTTSSTTKNSENSGTEVSTNNNNSQSLSSDNPQITIATQDYANQLERSETIAGGNITTSGNADESTSGTEKSESTGTESGKSSGKKDGTVNVQENGNVINVTDKTAEEESNKKESGTETENGTKNVTVTDEKTITNVTSDTGNTDTSDKSVETNQRNNSRNLSDDTTSKETRDKVSDRISSISGWRGSRSEEFKRFAESVKNINEMLLSDCNILFIGILPNPFMDTFNLPII